VRSLNGSLRGRGSCVRTGTSTPSCFFRGTDRRLKRIVFDGAQWSAWTDLGGAIAGDPSCVLLGDPPQFCLAIGTAGDVKLWSRVRGGTSSWRSLGGSMAVAQPACVTSDGATADCVAIGANAQLQHFAYR
jgi:hypothetical protein